MEDDGGRDDIPNVLCIPILEGLERDAHTLPVLIESRPPAVSRVDGRVDLHAEELAGPMGVRGYLHGQWKEMPADECSR